MKLDANILIWDHLKIGIKELINMVRCTDCWFMFYHDEINYEDMDCSHGNAIPENGAPKIID